MASTLQPPHVVIVANAHADGEVMVLREHTVASINAAVSDLPAIADLWQIKKLEDLEDVPYPLLCTAYDVVHLPTTGVRIDSRVRNRSVVTAGIWRALTGHPDTVPINPHPPVMSETITPISAEQNEALVAELAQINEKCEAGKKSLKDFLSEQSKRVREIYKIQRASGFKEKLARRFKRLTNVQTLVVEALKRPEGASLDEIQALTGKSREYVRGQVNGAMGLPQRGYVIEGRRMMAVDSNKRVERFFITASPNEAEITDETEVDDDTQAAMDAGAEDSEA